MRRGSIAVNLFWFSAGWLVLALIATGFLLTSLYSQALDTSLSETLEFYVESLAGGLLETSDPQSEIVRLPDPRFDRPRSGWYWMVRDVEGRVHNLSGSVVGIGLPPLQAQPDSFGVRSEVVTDVFGTQIRAIERTVTVDGATFSIVVTGSLSEILRLVEQFRGQTLVVLGAVGVMLAIMSALVARFALRPVGQLSRAVEQVREGESLAIEGRYPRELAPLAEEVNELLRSNTQIIERARNQVGNLAHGLKTPIAVLRNEAGVGGPLARIVAAETEKMNALVATHLDRARLTARSSVVGRRSDAVRAIERLTRVMAKIHPTRIIALEPVAPAMPWFRGEEADLEDMVGNLLDNACKWARDSVRVTLGAGSGQLRVTIEDDGPGLSPEEAGKVLRRGVRLDEKTPGSGLGLDIVKELVDVYGGTLTLERSVLGGVRAELTLPSARPPEARSDPGRTFAALGTKNEINRTET